MFSDREEKIIKIIGKKEMTLGDIAQKLFADEMPMDANIKVNNSVNRITTKCTWYKQSWTLTKTKENNRIVVKVNNK